MRIILRKSGIYDVYNQDGGWLFSRTAADNVFAELARMPDIPIEFVDETAEKGTYRTVQELTREELNELKQSYVAETVKNPSWGELADSVDILMRLSSRSTPALRLVPKTSSATWERRINQCCPATSALPFTT